MNTRIGSAVKAWNLILPVSVLCFVAISFDTTQARVMPFIWTQTTIHDFGEKPSNFNPVVGSRGVLEKFGYIEFVPNRTMILRNTLDNGSNLLQFNSVVRAIKISPKLGGSNSKWNIKIYGEGTEHKLPPFLERIIQRIQTYFSVYKYTDTSAVESLVLPVEEINVQVGGSSVDSSQNDDSNRTGSDFSGDKSDLDQPSPVLGIASMTQQDNGEYNEFILIGKQDTDLKVVSED